MVVLVIRSLFAIGRQLRCCGLCASTRGGVGILSWKLDIPLKPDHSNVLQFLRNFLWEYAYIKVLNGIHGIRDLTKIWQRNWKKKTNILTGSGI